MFVPYDPVAILLQDRNNSLDEKVLIVNGLPSSVSSQ